MSIESILGYVGSQYLPEEQIVHPQRNDLDQSALHGYGALFDEGRSHLL